MAGQRVDAKVDVVLMDRNRHLLLVQQEQVNFSTSCRTMTPYSKYTSYSALHLVMTHNHDSLLGASQLFV
jgi:hypothetical protein